MWFLRKMAWPISIVYGIVVYARNLLYDWQIFSSKSFSTPTLCVGNLSVGGTGKTPMIEFLVSKLKDKHQLAVLSRGYKRKSKGYVLAGPQSTVEDVGDEPYQMHQKFKEVPLAVDADRCNGIATLEQTVAPSLVLLDDAFQHRKVKPSFSVLLTTYNQPFFKDWYLPTGNLRDAKIAAKRAQVIVVTKCPENLAEDQMSSYRSRLQKRPGQLVVFAKLAYETTLYPKDINLALESLKKQTFTLVTGIANPAPLVAFLAGKGLNFEHLTYADHHHFTAAEIKLLQTKGLVLTTEKDFVRLQGKLDRLCYIRVAHQFLQDGEEQLLGAIAQQIKPCS